MQGIYQVARLVPTTVPQYPGAVVKLVHADDQRVKARRVFGEIADHLPLHHHYIGLQLPEGSTTACGIRDHSDNENPLLTEDLGQPLCEQCVSSHNQCPWGAHRIAPLSVNGDALDSF
jgi:hypothetical protein